MKEERKPNITICLDFVSVIVGKRVLVIGHYLRGAHKHTRIKTRERRFNGIKHADCGVVYTTYEGSIYHF